MTVVSLLVAAAIALPCSQTLVLESGMEIDICGKVDLSAEPVIFSATDGTLYSVARDEVAGLRVSEKKSSQEEEPIAKGAERRLSVSSEEKDRLLASLAKSRGTPRPRPADPPPSTRYDARPDREIEVSGESDELLWRGRARAAEERVLRAREELDLLLRRERKLEDELLGLRALGFRDNQFSYQIFQLQLTRDSMDRARLEIERAERARFQLMEDARKEGILPGWLR